MWGPPSGWDSAPSESHHKSEIKAPSKNTQQNANTLIRQLCTRKREKHLLRRVSHLYRVLDNSQGNQNSDRKIVHNRLCGS